MKTLVGRIDKMDHTSIEQVDLDQMKRDFAETVRAFLADRNFQSEFYTMVGVELANKLSVLCCKHFTIAD
jgi:hypothetical protein